MSYDSRSREAAYKKSYINLIIQALPADGLHMNLYFWGLQDQSERCLDLGIDTAAWNSGTSEAQRASIEKELRSGEPSIKLLYTTPESLRTPRLAAALQVVL